jgi:hypothetical protein
LFLELSCSLGAFTTLKVVERPALKALATCCACHSRSNVSGLDLTSDRTGTSVASMATSRLFEASILGASSLQVAVSKKERTVLCSWEEVPNGLRIDHDAMIKVLGRMIHPIEVEVMETLNKGWQWHVTTKTKNSSQALMGLIDAVESFFESEEGVKRKVTFAPLESREVTCGCRHMCRTA